MRQRNRGFITLTVLFLGVATFLVLNTAFQANLRLIKQNRRFRRELRQRGRDLGDRLAAPLAAPKTRADKPR